MRRIILILSGLLFLALLIASWMEARRPEPVALIPTLTRQTEYCLTCHSGLPEISLAHPVETFGCIFCHGGERLSLNAILAHSTMRGGGNPSDFLVVQASCGGNDCHSGATEDYRDHIQRATTSIQATYAGAIANIRYTFGSQPDLTARLGIFTIRDPLSTTEITELAAFDPALETIPSIQNFARVCLFCHLSTQPLQGDKYARFTGCAACHTPQEPSVDKKSVHVLKTAIPYTQCNTRHNRGNYDLRSMTFVPRNDQPSPGSEQRLQDYYQPIAQFTRCEWTLDCIDCHTRAEVMGNGDLHNNKKEIQYIRCKTCHGTLTELPNIRTLTDPDDLAFRLARLNPVIDLQLGDSIITTDKGEPLWNIRQLPDGTFEMSGKATGQSFTFRPVKGTACKQKPDEQESRYCHACHVVVNR